MCNGLQTATCINMSNFDFNALFDNLLPGGGGGGRETKSEEIWHEPRTVCIWCTWTFGTGFEYLMQWMEKWNSSLVITLSMNKHISMATFCTRFDIKVSLFSIPYTTKPCMTGAGWDDIVSYKGSNYKKSVTSAHFVRNQLYAWLTKGAPHILGINRLTREPVRSAKFQIILVYVSNKGLTQKYHILCSS